jgi:uncharacterized protein (DUF488 family)
MSDIVYTIGHSTHSLEQFISLLHRHAITALCDVRSRPYSRMHPQFNRETLTEVLQEAGIKYVFLGKELGARSEDKSCYRDGQARYELIARTGLFQSGIDRVKDGAHKFRVALMCAEKEPLECHRTILVGRRLIDDGLQVKHILADGKVEDHSCSIDRLIAMLKISRNDMFRSPEDVVTDAYTLQGNAIAYREQSSDSVQPDRGGRRSTHGAVE